MQYRVLAGIFCAIACMGVVGRFVSFQSRGAGEQKSTSSGVSTVRDHLSADPPDIRNKVRSETGDAAPSEPQRRPTSGNPSRDEEAVTAVKPNVAVREMLSVTAAKSNAALRGQQDDDGVEMSKPERGSDVGDGDGGDGDDGDAADVRDDNDGDGEGGDDRGDGDDGDDDDDGHGGKASNGDEVTVGLTGRVTGVGPPDDLLRESRTGKCTGMYQFLVIHVPKSGGTTVHHTLSRTCFQTGRLQCQLCQCTHAHLIDLAPRARYLFGKKSWYEPFDRNCVRLIAVLRNPVSRIVSAFSETSHMLLQGEAKTCNHFKCVKEQRQRILARNFTLEDAIFWQPHPYYQMNIAAVYYMSHLRNGDEAQEPQLLKKYVDGMLNRLRNSVDFVLLTEHLEEGLMLLAAKYNVSMPKVYHAAKNSSVVPRPRLSDALRQEIEKQNFADVLLYREAEKIYDKQKRELLAELAPRVPAPFVCAAKLTTERRQVRRVCDRKKQWLDSPP